MLFLILLVATFSSSRNTLGRIPLAFSSQRLRRSTGAFSWITHTYNHPPHTHANHSVFTTQKCTVKKCACVCCTYISSRLRNTAAKVCDLNHCRRRLWSLQWSWTWIYSMVWEHTDIPSDQTKSTAINKTCSNAIIIFYHSDVTLFKVPFLIGCMQSREPPRRTVDCFAGSSLSEGEAALFFL